MQQRLFTVVRRFGAALSLAIAVALAFGIAPVGAAAEPTRTTGSPTSSNGASSMHLLWSEATPATTEVSTVLEVTQEPTVDSLYFWALQVDFAQGATKVGSAHLGLQWDPSRSGRTAVNFGGYGLADGEKRSELSGTSMLSSSNGDANTLDYDWQPGRRYRLRIVADGAGWWRGEITDLTTGAVTVVRRLHAGGTALVKPMVWSEVFARCDAPSTEVRWSELTPAPKSLLVTYQTYEDGGCTNTTAAATPGGFGQRTSTERLVRSYDLLRVGWGI